MPVATPRRSMLPALALLVSISVLGMGAIHYGTTWGANVSGDSVKYIAAARNLLAGHGLSINSPSGRFSPLIHWPPLYPTLLAGVGLLGTDPARAARWLNLLLFGGTLILAGTMIWRYTGRAAWGAAAAALTAVAPPLLFIHTAAWSEPLFLFCGLGGVALLAAYLQRGQLGFLASSGLLFAAGLLTRYAGICLVPTALVGIFLLSQQSLGMRLRDCLIFGLIACLPLAGWIVRNHNVSDESTDRSMVYHALTMDQLEEGFDTMRNWVLPDAPPRHVYSLAVSATMAGIMLLALLVVPPLMWRLSPEPADGLSRLPHLLWIFALFYLGTILLSQTFFDAGIPLDDRILSPIYAAGLLLLICLAYRWPGRGRPAALAAVVVIALLCFGADAVRGKSQLQKWHQRGAGLNRKPWVQCATLAALDELHLPPEAAIYSNAADAIEFRTARLASQLPNKSNEGMRQINSHYAKELADMSRRLRRTHGVIVLFAPNLSNRKYVATADELTAEFPLRLVAQCSDGEIYALDERPTSRP